MDDRLGNLLLVLALGAVAWAGGCGGTDVPEPAGDRLTVFVGVEPVAYLVRRVSGPHADVHVLVPAGQDPHTFQPTPRQMTSLGRASLFFKVGLPLEERLLEKLQQSHPELTVIDTAEGIKKRMLRGPGEHEEHDGHDHAEEMSGADPHVWLVPALVRIQAENIAEALRRADPDHAEDYTSNLAGLLQEIDALDAKIRRRLEPHKGRAFYVFHPSYGYFADAYGLKQEAVEVGGRKPTARQLRALMHKAQAENVQVVFAQPQFDQHSARVVADAIGGTVVTIDPLAEDVLANLDAMSEKIAAALEKQ